MSSFEGAPLGDTDDTKSVEWIVPALGVGSLGRLGEVESIDGRLMELPSLNASVTDAGTNRWSPATASTIFENIGGGLQRSIGHN